MATTPLLMTPLSDAILALCGLENGQWRLKRYGPADRLGADPNNTEREPSGMAEFKLIQTPTLALAFGLVIRFCVFLNCRTMSD